MEKKLIATGIDILGDRREFDCSSGYLWCDKRDLISITIPEGVVEAYCHHNLITELTLPKGIREVFCAANQLTELILPEGIKSVSCEDNKITLLDIPDSVIELWADKEVTGLEKYIGTKMSIDLF